MIRIGATPSLKTTIPRIMGLLCSDEIWKKNSKSGQRGNKPVKTLEIYKILLSMSFINLQYIYICVCQCLIKGNLKTFVILILQYTNLVYVLSK